MAQGYTIDRKKHRPAMIISYHCPKCGGDMFREIALGIPVEIWKCEDCLLYWELAFREAKQNE